MKLCEQKVQQQDVSANSTSSKDTFTRNQETFPKEAILEGGHYIHTNDKL